MVCSLCLQHISYISYGISAISAMVSISAMVKAAANWVPHACGDIWLCRTEVSGNSTSMRLAIIKRLALLLLLIPHSPHSFLNLLPFHNIFLLNSLQHQQPLVTGRGVPQGVSEAHGAMQVKACASAEVSYSHPTVSSSILPKTSVSSTAIRADKNAPESSPCPAS